MRGTYVQMDDLQALMFGKYNPFATSAVAWAAVDSTMALASCGALFPKRNGPEPMTVTKMRAGFECA